ncbi:phospholipase effector Tle1 domain-containing protein [Marinobacter fonticola]|uniref:phospholipase effector Tle1 domain-containing protein n=1 Tax=Marinobacter fonticola TaxID=2603215 RepID=UPI0011E6B827|nr:DUF2235 domain-containing protein [Marinobacter fonticola]
MKVKSYTELALRDLPYIENPFFAASYASRLLDDRFANVPRDPLGRTISCEGLKRALKNGHLFLVFSSVEGKPFSPVVAWKADSAHPKGGLWHLECDGVGSGLAHDVESLNKWEVTPQTVVHSGPGGIGHLRASGFDGAMIERRTDERYRAQQETDRKLSLPLGASASIAPLASAATPPPATYEKPPEKKNKQRKPVHLEVGIFTDGTLNNAGNIDVFRQRVENECLAPHQNGDIGAAECERRLALLLGNSYANGTSNVAKLRDLYPETDEETEAAITFRRRVYAPGPGSKTGAPDSLEGSMTGLGKTGVIAQVNNAFAGLALVASNLLKDDVIDVLTIDLFGFSRGAAAARHAANEIASGSGGGLGHAFAAMDMQWPKTVAIRFLGLFDTVAGIVNIPDGDFIPSNDLNAPVKLDLDPGSVSTAVQFTAIDECRENFALNSLCNPDGTLPDNFREIALPGAHSDIGGGYHESQTEQLLLSPTLSIEGSATAWPEQTPQWDNLATLEALTEAEGWIGSHCLPLATGEPAALRIYKTVREHPVPDGQVDLDLKLHRQVRGELSQVYLHCMYHLAKRAGIPLDKMDPTDSATTIPKELDLAYRILWEHISQGNDQPKLPPAQNDLLKQRYVHHSDHYNLLEFLIGDTIARSELPFSNARFLSPFRPTSDRKRIVYANQPET